MSAHTPGPWSVSSVGAGFEVEDCAGVCVAQAQQTAPESKPGRHETRRANARLIAAAPELLAALKNAIKTAEFESHPYRQWQQLAREAIAKAEGRV